MMVSWVVLLLACSGPAPVEKPPAQPALAASERPKSTDSSAPVNLSVDLPEGFKGLRQSHSTYVPLHHLSGSYELSSDSIPQELRGLKSEYVLDVSPIPNPKKAKRLQKMSRAEMPFATPKDKFKPKDMQVFAGPNHLAFSRESAPLAKNPSWRINGKHIILSTPEVPQQITIRYPGPKALIDRHDPATSDLTSEQFVRYSMSTGRKIRTTRHGLLLPAPAKATWEVTLPEKAQFEATIGLEAPGIPGARSDGAKLSLSVIFEGKTHEVETFQVPMPKDALTKVTADLSKWAKKKVQVVLTTSNDDDKNALFDWVFVGAPGIRGAPTGPVRRVIVVGLDTTRPDHFSLNGYHRDTTPALDALAQSSVVFEKAWSVAPRTRPAFRSATTGKRPLEAVNAKNIGTTFAENGFATAGFVANIHLQPRFGFDQGFDTWRFDGVADAQGQVDLALEYLKDSSDRDTYVFLHFMDPHMPYGAPVDAERYLKSPRVMKPKVQRTTVLNKMKTGRLTSAEKTELQALHDGEMHYLDSHLARFIKEVDKLEGETLIIVHSDHGEEFWDHEGFEHNHTLYDEVTRAIFWIRPKGGTKQPVRPKEKASIMDIAPTLYDLVGFRDGPAVHGRSLVPLLDGEDDEKNWTRPLPLGHVQYSHDRWGVLLGDKKYVLHTGSGVEDLFDLKTDPKELKNLASSENLEPFRHALKEAHEISAGPGWRIRLSMQAADRGFEVKLPQKAVWAEVLDPELAAESRANLEWGERPKRKATDIGLAVLTEDRLTLRFAAGQVPAGGTIIVMFEEPQSAEKLEFQVGEKLLTEVKPNHFALEVPRADGDSTMVGKLVVEPGYVVIPPPSEAVRMGLVEGQAGNADEMALLKKLGYVH